MCARARTCPHTSRGAGAESVKGARARPRDRRRSASCGGGEGGGACAGTGSERGRARGRERPAGSAAASRSPARARQAAGRVEPAVPGTLLHQASCHASVCHLFFTLQVSCRLPGLRGSNTSVFIFVENPLYRTISGGRRGGAAFKVISRFICCCCFGFSPKKLTAISIDLFEFILKFVEFLGL